MPGGATRLFGQAIAPVAHPSLGIRSLRSARSLAQVALLEFDNPQYPWLQWGDWLKAAGWGTAKSQGVLHFNQYDQVIQAALDGQGVALGRLELIQPLLDSGRLLQLAQPDRQAGNPHAYWLLQTQAQPRDEVRRVADWIAAEALACVTGM